MNRENINQANETSTTQATSPSGFADFSYISDSYFSSDSPSEDVQTSASEARLRAQYDYRFFIALLMGDALTMPTPDFHLEVFSRMVSLTVPQSVYALPRGFAKTTIARLAVCYILTFTDVKNIFYFSHSLDLAIPSVNAIVRFLKSPNYANVFGKPSFLVEQLGKGSYRFIMPSGKVCNLRARGANQQIRGTNVDNVRVELAILDDIEDREENNNPQIYASLKKWFYGDMKKALDHRKGKIIQIGNIVSANSLVAEHCDSPYWFSMRYSAIKSDGTPLWPELWSLSDLVKDYEEYASQGLTAAWFGEMMNIILPEGSQLISVNEILFRERPEPGQLACGFITVDPAISSDPKSAHKTAIAVHGFWDNCWQIVDHYCAIGLDPIKLYDIVLSLANRWGVSVVGIESEAYQASIKYVFEYIERREGMASRLKVIQMPTQKRAKYARIATWVGYLKRHEYCLTRGDINTTNQLLAYDSSKANNSDDLIDTESYGVYMITKHLSTITASTRFALSKPNDIIINFSPI